MKRMWIGVWSLLLFYGPTLQCQEPGLDEILQRYYQASGIAGEKNWETVIMTGKTVSPDSEYPYTVLIKRPGTVRTELVIQGTKMITVWDGTKGWSIVPWGGSLAPQDMTPDESKELREQADIEGALYQWKEKGYSVRLVGREELEGTPVFNVELTRPSGDKENYYLDAGSFLLLKVAYHVKVMGHVQERETYLTNYRQVEGAYLPYAIAERYPGPYQQGGNQFVFDEIRINQPVSDTLFVKP